MLAPAATIRSIMPFDRSDRCLAWRRPDAVRLSPASLYFGLDILTRSNKCCQLQFREIFSLIWAHPLKKIPLLAGPEHGGEAYRKKGECGKPISQKRLKESRPERSKGSGQRWHPKLVSAQRRLGPLRLRRSRGDDTCALSNHIEMVCGETSQNLDDSPRSLYTGSQVKISPQMCCSLSLWP